MKRPVSLRSLIAIAVVVSCSVALAAWPERTIQYVIAFAPGGESDVAARLQAETLKSRFGKEMIVVNKPGAGGGLAWSQMNTTPGDGYTITAGTPVFVQRRGTGASAADKTLAFPTPGS